MKARIVLLLINIVFLLSSCNWSKWLSKKIEEIIVPSNLTCVLGEEIKFVIDYKPRKMTTPEFVVEYNEEEFDIYEMNNEYYVKPKEFGAKYIKIVDLDSEVQKIIDIGVYKPCDDFTIAIDNLSLSKNILFEIPVQLEPDGLFVLTDFEITYDQDLLNYDEERKIFQTVGVGDSEIMYFEKNCKKNKIIKVAINDDLKIYDDIDLSIGVLKELPEEILSDIAEHDLRVEYDVSNEFMYQNINNSVLSTGLEDVELRFLKNTIVGPVVFSKVNLKTKPWFSSEFFFAQRVINNVGKTLKTDDLISKMENDFVIDFSVSNTYSERKYLTVAELEAYSDQKSSSTVQGKSFNMSTICLEKNPELKDIKATYSYSNKKTLKQIKDDVNIQNAIKEVVPNKAAPNTKLTLGSSPYLSYEYGCHSAAGLRSGSANNHMIYIFPLSNTILYSEFKSIVDKHFTAQRAKIIADFNKKTTGTTYTIEALQTTTTDDGVFEFKENYNNKIYDNAGSSSGNWLPEGNAIVNTLNYSNSGVIKTVKITANQLPIESKTGSSIQPGYVVVRKIIVKWEDDDINLASFVLLNDKKNHTISYVIDDRSRILTINITENDLSNEKCVLNEVLGIMTFVRGNQTFYKNLELKQLD